MYKTTKISVWELVARMRMMKPGEEIGLSQTTDGEYSYGIRCLPGAMFDNGMCWLADYYGGGCVTAFSETEQQFMEDTGILLDEVRGWLVEQDLVDQDFDLVNIQIKDGSLPETKWEFKATEIPAKNRMVSVSFILSHGYQTKISVPPKATDDEIIELTKAALIDCDKAKFQACVFDADAKYWGIWPEDFVDMVVNHDYKQPTDQPTGTLSK